MLTQKYPQPTADQKQARKNDDHHRPVNAPIRENASERLPIHSEGLALA